jgi:hypothetical protein
MSFGVSGMFVRVALLSLEIVGLFNLRRIRNGSSYQLVTVGFVELSTAHEYDAGRVLALLLDSVVHQRALSRRCILSRV